MSVRSWLGAALAVAAFLAAGQVRAAVFHVDPVRGDMSGDGSYESPWSTLQEVMEAGLVESRQCETLPYEEGCTMVVVNPGAPIKAGDTVVLYDGYHGEVTIQDAYNEDYITIEAGEGQEPGLKSIRILGAAMWIVRGLSVSPSHAPSYEAVGNLVLVEDHNWRGPARDIVIERCEIFSMSDSSGWTIDDWNNLPCNGIAVQGDDVVVRDNHLLNVDFGISVSGDRARVQRNTVENFAGDGLRGLGDDGLFEYNVVMNCYDVNENHDDGFQSWSVGSDGEVGTGVVRGVVLRGNTIINYTDPDQPFRGTLQGIGCFDGMFEDWVVENNVVITDHWHGISLYGALNCRVVNNTVIDINEVDPGPSWIHVVPHKDGTPSTGCVVRNNLAMSLDVPDPGNTVDHNLEIDYAWASLYFVDRDGFDLHPTADSPAVDTGSRDMAPAVDRDAIPRPQGPEVDIGAYEWYEGDPVYPDDHEWEDVTYPEPRPDGAADAPSDTTDDGGGDAGASSGCSCTMVGARPGPSLWVLLVLAALGVRPGRPAHG